MRIGNRTMNTSKEMLGIWKECKKNGKFGSYKLCSTCKGTGVTKNPELYDDHPMCPRCDGWGYYKEGGGSVSM